MEKLFRCMGIFILVVAMVGAFQAAPVLASASTPFNLTPASPLGVQFLQVATVANIVGDGMVIDHPLTNGKPDAIIIVTPVWNPGGIGGTYHDYPVGVYYFSGQWWIFNEDGTTMQAGAAFNVLIPTPGANVFVQTVATGVGAAVINNSLTNNNPNAMILVTQNWNPGGVGGIYNNHSVGVWYNGSHQWEVFNQNASLIPDGAAFNVFILPSGAGIFVQTSKAGNSSGDATYVDNPLTNGNPNAMVFVTPNRNPGGVGGIGYDHNFGVFYNGAYMAIFNQDTTPMPINASFNVLVLVPQSDIFVHIHPSAFYINSLIDNALTNGHPDAMVFVTSNWNPGGVGGIYNNHNIGIAYNSVHAQWQIGNQDLVGLQTNAAFNVLIPNPDTSVFVHKATAGNSLGDHTSMDYPLTNNKPNAIVFVTPNFNPGNVGGTYNDHAIGVYYNSGKWLIFNQDGIGIPVDASFNVFVPPPGPRVFVHTATSGNSIGHSTDIDNPLSNNNPNAIVLVTPNWNPGGVGGTFDNHPIGVYYTGIKWAIFNQDLATMPLGASFNVFISSNLNIFLPLVPNLLLPRT